ncbi:MAG TPA: protein-glutamate O-methyltransferase CheR [Terriglobales bacterium]|nr:protein-glutamate O-methyltransferase CheR [Terriglobales bacterium]
MNKLSTTVAILEHELSEIRLILERKTGVLLRTPTEQLSEIVAEYLDPRQSASTTDLLERLRSSDSECESLTERLVGGETGFFRCPAAFDSLAKVVIPELQSRKTAEHPHNLRVWSAGCATGEEPYSIAMSVCEAVNCSAGAWKVHIVGSDIRRHAVQVAERGLYPQSALRHVSRELVQGYFAKVGQHLLVKPRLRNLVTFTPMNLAAPTYIGRFDCIFCMDVLPHFSTAQRIALVQRLHLYLEPGGYLFLGDGEKIPAMDLTFNYQKNADYILYQKPLAATAKAGR